uniref:Uncharacterized protein n=1 Tax=Eutreptiella gymnastica TaxID=73025 RepID=A0A7S1I0A8_9EUGL|mmetsp:Transcript_118620/g.206579  ORF Transcript_118620/g.206579 Transcript_118620/m.206579 type:complete len:827 (+) Transcript_118620:73-2553(+)
MAVFGVDFGNLASKISVARRGGIDIIVNEVSKRETTSLVSFGDKSRNLGEKALDLAVRNWANTIGNLKRLVGVKYGSEAYKHEAKFLRNQMRAAIDGTVEFKVRYKYDEHWFRPEQLIAALFSQLRIYAEREAAEEAKMAPGTIKVNDCVVSCPAYYTCHQRKLLQQALTISGLNPLTLMNETTSAALDWGIFKTSTLPEKEEDAQVVAIVDVGHSATTCTLVSFMKGQLKVIGHVFDTQLGVRDFDHVLFEHFSAEIKKKYGMDLSEDKKNSIRLMSAIDKLKKVLSANAVSPLNCEMGEVDVSFPDIKREFAEDLWAPLISRMDALMQKFKTLPGADKLYAAEIIGGGSRIPCIKSSASTALGMQLQTTLNASESIAKGCGIMGAMLSPKFKVRDFTVIDANMYTLNLGYHSDKSTNPISDKNFPEINKKMVVLKPGDACPKTLNLTFDRSQDFELFVFYEENPELGSEASDLLVGKWKVSKIPQLAEPSSVRVRLRINPSMLISVEGAFVTEEWEEEEEVEVKKEEKKSGEASPPAPGSPTGTNMETDKETPAKEEPAKEIRKVKKKKTHECAVECLQQPGHSDSRVRDMTDLELSMIASDKNVLETAEMKNAVEEYILSMRSKLAQGTEHGAYMADADRETFTSQCNSIEDWLYGDGDDAAKDDYAQKMADLKKLGEPPMMRYEAFMAVAPAVKAFKAKATELATQAANSGGKLDHIPAAELQSVVAKANELAAWVDGEFAKNNSAPKTAPPPLSASVVAAKQQELTTFALPILNTPKPKEEPKPEEPKTEEAPKEGEAPASPKPEGEAAPEKPAENKMDLD